MLYIPPIYHHNNYITDFKEKAKIFNNFFAKKCTVISSEALSTTISLIRNNHCESKYELEAEFKIELEVKIEFKAEFKNDF